jgi:hypothetical protein
VYQRNAKISAGLRVRRQAEAVLTHCLLTPGVQAAVKMRVIAKDAFVHFRIWDVNFSFKCTEIFYAGKSFQVNLFKSAINPKTSSPLCFVLN